ncbi:MAG: hypothetical protein R2883_02450 [Caldisericia bacterium]
MATEDRNPKAGKIRFDKNGDLFLFTVQYNLSAKYSKSGSLIESIGAVIDPTTDFVATEKNLFFC